MVSVRLFTLDNVRTFELSNVLTTEGSMAGILNLFGRKVLITLVVTVVATVITFALRSAGANSVLVFVFSAIALAGLASLVGDGTDQLGHRLGHGATGVLQS